jgi:hypothetical protein
LPVIRRSDKLPTKAAYTRVSSTYKRDTCRCASR